MNLSDWESATPTEVNCLIHFYIFEQKDEHNIPDYSGDIREAWMIADRERLVVRPDLIHGWYAGKLKSVRLDGVGLEYEHATRHDDPAMAICRAALKFYAERMADGWRKLPNGGPWAKWD